MLFISISHISVWCNLVTKLCLKPCKNNAFDPVDILWSRRVLWAHLILSAIHFLKRWSWSDWPRSSFFFLMICNVLQLKACVLSSSHDFMCRGWVQKDPYFLAHRYSRLRHGNFRSTDFSHFHAGRRFSKRLFSVFWHLLEDEVMNLM